MLITRIRPGEQAVETEAPTAGAGPGLPDRAVLDFAGGLPGFPGARGFRLEMLAPEYGPFFLMRSVDQAEICFVVTVAGALFPEYTVTIDEQHVASLGLASVDDAVVLCIITLGERPTANLLGPLVVNRQTQAAAQVVQYESGYRASEPLAPRSEP
ncbi:MAG TPA: flagellar assembly protein FliW [Acidimicrobiales bacterium]|jgi:flagellar assembly factor FliW|nr:flagellar assembly protein FliW [Acidimicrobiales bacterium]